VADLTAAVHEAVAGGSGLVVWYDSVHLKTGLVDWQSRVNDANAAFLDACGEWLPPPWSVLQCELPPAPARELAHC
jgi:hypothetical protein